MIPLLEEVLQLETKVWEALRTGNAELDAEMLTDDFVGVYPTGFSTKAEHYAQLKDGPTVISYELVDSRLTVLTNDIVLLSYLARWQRVTPHGTGNQVRESMFISSLWKRINNKWLNSFSQDTPALA